MHLTRQSLLSATRNVKLVREIAPHRERGIADLRDFGPPGRGGSPSRFPSSIAHHLLPDIQSLDSSALLFTANHITARSMLVAGAISYLQNGNTCEGGSIVIHVRP